MRYTAFFICCFAFSPTAWADFEHGLPKSFVPDAPVHPQAAPQPNGSGRPPAADKAPQSPVPPKKSTATQPSSPEKPASDMGSHDNNAPVLFSGDQGSGSRKTGVINLIGHAVITQDDTTLTSHLAQIFSLPGNLPTTGSGRVQRALAKGHVHILKNSTPASPEIRASADETEFLVGPRVLVLRGNAKVWRAKEYLHGDQIKINLSSGDIEILKPQGTLDPRSVGPSAAEKR